MYKKVKPLRQGSKIKLIAPGSPFEKTLFEAGIKKLKEIGIVPVYDESIFEKVDYLAGSDQTRTQYLLKAFSDSDIDGVLTIRGGYGCVRILKEIGIFPEIANYRFFCGFSDITSLHVLFGQFAGFVTFYGPNSVSLSKIEDTCFEHFKNVIFNRSFEEYINNIELQPVKNGVAIGTLCGGNLSVLVSLIGTPFELDLTGKILFLEDTNEYPYRLDRMLTQLSLTRSFKGLKGVVFGDMGLDGEEEQVFHRFLSNLARFINGPVVYNFPMGHRKKTITLPFFIKVRLDGNEGRLMIHESPFENEK